ncbi:MAG: TonB-dependent receptor [Pseudobacteriovorax sp.]|nr:TonB-dependent receptor [Pseudobacteriovorax sp.]
MKSRIGGGEAASLKLKFGQSAAHRFVIDANYSRILSFKEEALPGIGDIERVSTNEYPAWRMNTNFVYTLGGFETNLSNKRIARHKKLQSEGYVGNFSWWDAQIRYAHVWDGAVTLGSTNILNAKPPLDDSQVGQDQLANNLYNAYGRTYYIGLSQNL